MAGLEIIIGNAEEADVPGIRAAAGVSWRMTYKDIYPPDFIESFLDRAYSVESLTRAVNNPNTVFLVARQGKKVVGYCQFGPAIQLQGIELYRLYVPPEYWRRGVGRKLIAALEAKLREQGVKSYFCYVHARNEVGKAFYLKSGFVRDLSHDKSKDEEWFLIKHL